MAKTPKVVTAKRSCPVCGHECTGTGRTRFEAEVVAEKAVLVHKLDHPFSVVMRARPN